MIAGPRALAGRLERLRAGDHAWGRMSRATKVALVALGALVVLAVLGGAIAPYPAARNLVGPAAHAPDGAHPFGTDVLGRDVLSRVLAGAHVSIVVAIVTPLLGLVVGAVLGAGAAVAPRAARTAIDWLLELLVTFPGIVLAVAAASLLGPSLTTTVIVLSGLYAPAIARVVRAAIRSEYTRDYVAAEIAMGARAPWILWRHVARNVAGPVLVFVTALSANAVLVEASLSFVGLGVQPPTPSWGNIVNDGLQLIDSGGWWVSTFAGLAIFVTVLVLTVVSDGVAAAVGIQGTGVAANQAAPAPLAPGADTDRAALPGTPEPAPRSATRRRPVPRRPDALLEVQALSVRFPAAHGDRRLVSDVSLSVDRGEIAGVVGESGSGKSLTTLAISGLLPPGAAPDGAIFFDGEELLGATDASRHRLRGRRIASVHQDALAALNPGRRIGRQLEQVCRVTGRHRPGELLELVQLSPSETARRFPHQLSGGQRQRVLIAMALAGDPELLLADEPTTALDVTLQAEIGRLLAEIVRDRGLSMLLVSHDLAFVAELADRVCVMRDGRLVESGPTADVLHRPRHPYTRALVDAVTTLERAHRTPTGQPA